ncbi:Inner membrane transport permease YhhJ [compost metagenome]
MPVNFQSDLLAGRSPELQINVDATAMSQAFMGAGYIGRIFERELLDYSQRNNTQSPVVINAKALFNPNLEGGWFLAVIQIVNNITILAIILTGTALLREREHGTLDHLLVLPLTALEIMLAKIASNALVVVICTWISLVVVVKGALGVPLSGSMGLFLAVTALYLFASTALGIFLATLARSTPQFGLLAIPVIIPMLLLSGGSTPLDSMPQWLQWVMQGSPSTHFVSLGAAILFRDAGWTVVWPDILALAVIGLVFFGVALARFRRSLAS